MSRGIRYTPEQKEKMKKQALELLGQGKKQTDVAEVLGTTITTLHALLEGETYPGQRSRATAVSPGLSKLDPSNPVLQMAAKRQRLTDILITKAALDEEEQQLREEMKSLYETLGKEIFGADVSKK